jgi:uncharacterized membrane protein
MAGSRGITMITRLLRPHDWKTKDLIFLTVLITVVFALLVALGAAGIDIPVIRQIVAFIFLTFVPGMLILRILRIHNINPVEAVVYITGLSIAFIMLCGTVINFTLPLFNIPAPIQTIPVAISLCLCNMALMITAYARDRNYQPEPAVRLSNFNVTPVLFLLFLVAFLILGVTVNNVSGKNIILLICLILICFVIAMAAFKRFILPSMFPLAIFSISICLLFQTTLMSPYLVGTDIYVEYQVFQQVYQHGIWNYSIPNPVNSCLSIAILGPVYARLLNVDSLWVFKAIYPFIFSFVPLALLRIFRIQFGPYRALFATFLFMAVPTFSLEMISLCRQQVAQLFFVVFILLLVDRRINHLPKLIMATIFVVSISISHYSFGIIGLIFMVTLIIFCLIMKNPLFITLWKTLTRKTGGLPQQFERNSADDLPFFVYLIPIVIFIIFESICYSCISSGINMELLTVSWTTYTGQLAEQVGGALSTHSASFLINFGQRDELIKAALGLDFQSVSWQGKIFRILQYITQILIAIGCLRLLFSPRGLKIKPEYVSLSVTSVLLLLACIFIIGFAERLNATRWYHIALITLAPFCILGGEVVWQAIKSLVFRLRRISIVQNDHGDSPPNYKIAFSLCILMPYFLVTSGFLYEITGQSVKDKADTPYSIALSSNRIDFIGVFNKKDGAAASWLSSHAEKSALVSTDNHAYKLLSLIRFPGQMNFLNQVDSLASHYIYFSSWNLSRGELTYYVGPGLRHTVIIENAPQLKGISGNSYTVYVNSGAKVLLTM